jgi:hypothetical protein
LKIPKVALLFLQRSPNFDKG